jgi:hypothetical protein
LTAATGFLAAGAAFAAGFFTAGFLAAVAIFVSPSSGMGNIHTRLKPVRPGTGPGELFIGTN